MIKTSRIYELVWKCKKCFEIDLAEIRKNHAEKTKDPCIALVYIVEM